MRTVRFCDRTVHFWSDKCSRLLHQTTQVLRKMTHLLIATLHWLYFYYFGCDGYCASTIKGVQRAGRPALAAA